MWLRWKDGREPACPLPGDSAKHKNRQQYFHPTPLSSTLMVLLIPSESFVLWLGIIFFGKHGDHVTEFRRLFKRGGALVLI